MRSVSKPRLALITALLFAAQVFGVPPATGEEAAPEETVPDQFTKEAPGRHEGPPFYRRGKDAPMTRFLERYADRLEIGEQARAEIQEIVDASRAEAEQYQEQLHALRMEMRTLLRKEKPDEEAVMKQAERIGEVRTGGHKHRLRTILKIRAKLTPEQRRELVRIHQERKKQRDR